MSGPREVPTDGEPWKRRIALAALAREPEPGDREILEEHLFDPDPSLALLAHLGLRKLFPAPSRVDSAWRGMFQESVDILEKRSTSGPFALRLAAVQALAFAPRVRQKAIVEHILHSLEEATGMEGTLTFDLPAMPLIQGSRALQFPEGFALLLASLASEADAINLLQRELSREDPAQLLPVLIALQMHPLSELSDKLLGFLRHPDLRICVEAARALLACGGPKTALLLLSHLKESANAVKKAQLLNMLAGTGRAEVQATLVEYLQNSSPVVRKAAISGIMDFPIPVDEKAALLNPLVDDPEAKVALEAASAVWHLGSLKALSKLESALNHGSAVERAIAAENLGRIPPRTSLPILMERFSHETRGDVLRALILSLRRLLPQAGPDPNLCERILPKLQKLMDSGSNFLRTQGAILCGTLGAPAEEIILKALDRADHPYVIASLVSALGKTGHSRLLVLARFCDHPDPRVRANLMNTLLNVGQSAIPYLTTGLKDPAPRVRTAAARSLFLLGQLEVVPVLNRMLLVPSPVHVLSACHSLGQLMRICPPSLLSDHPLMVSLGREVKKVSKASPEGPALLREPLLSELFFNIAGAASDPGEFEEALHRAQKANPSSHAIRRMLASACASRDKHHQAITLLEACLHDRPSVLADLLDIYRVSVMAGDFGRAQKFGKLAHKTYTQLLHACFDLARNLKGAGSEALLERLHSLEKNPSMNLYSAMIQLKAQQGDNEVLLDLLSELLLARPNNPLVAEKLSNLLPREFEELKSALAFFARSLRGSVAKGSLKA